MRCLTITLNAAVDTTYVLDTLVRGDANRVSRKLEAPGGKGNNVGRVLAVLGHSVVASGFIAGRSGGFIEDGLRSLGIETAFLEVPGESRVCLTLVERDSGVITEVLEAGVEIPGQAASELLPLARALARQVDTVVVSGSLPAGLPSDYYAGLLSELRPLPARLALDSSGEALRLGLESGPDVIKPNAAEMAALIGGERSSVPEMVEFARTCLIGAVLPSEARVLLSLGEEGAVLITREGALKATPPRIKIVNTVGCGDALLAGYLDAEFGADDSEYMVRQAVAVGAAAALQEIQGVVDRADVARLRESVKIEFL